MQSNRQKYIIKMMDWETSGSMVKEKKSNMNKENLRSIHWMCYKILLNLEKNCHLQTVQTIYGNLELGLCIYDMILHIP